MFRRYFLLTLILIFALASRAQVVSVSSFVLNEKDLTANQHGTTVYDQNGEKCALIKIFTTETGFTFDVGSLGVAKTEQKVGEIWVYVPHGIKKINLSHPILQRLEYSISIPIVKARTYEMRLTSDEVKTIIKRTVRSQYVLFKVSPQDALVELDGQTLAVTDGTATKRMPFGTYSYKVQAPRHAVKSGTIVVNDPKNKHIVNISLEPQYVNARFSVANNAEIWIDEQKRGTGSCTLELGFGIYMVECRLPGHKPSQQEIQIDRNSATGTITLTPPIPVYGSVDINTIPAEAEIWIDGKQVGTTPMFLSECLVGRHEILLKKSGYKDKKLNLLVCEAQTASVGETLEKGFSSDGRTFTVNGVSFEMVFVEGGTFRMGSNSRGCDEDPVHDVTLSSYYIGKTEVTQALWKAVMGRNPSEFIGDSLPVENVDWSDCQEFINRINVIAGTKFRLPTEAEWEYAARGGKYSKGYRYSGSNCIDSVAWYYNNSASKTHHVGSKQPNELGIHDMTGNVWEWCSDWYGLYSRDAQTNPSGARIGIKRVRRGGKCTSGEAFCSSTYRHTYTPDLMTSNTGLRLALSNESIDVSDDNCSRNLGSDKFKVHKVKKGESLASIARKYATTVRKLCVLNSISVKTALREGQILRIP